MMSETRKKRVADGKFFPRTEKPQGHPSPKWPFIHNLEINRKVLAKRGMEAIADKPGEEEKGLFFKFDVEDHLKDVGDENKGKMGDLLTNAVRATVEAAIPTMTKAVKEVCLSVMREEVNPHLLRLQYKNDELAQQLRRDNLRIAGVKEEEEATEEGTQGAKKEETKEMLHAKVIRVVQNTVVTITRGDLSTCYSVGRKVHAKVRHNLVRFSLRRKWDDIYASRLS